MNGSPKPRPYGPSTRRHPAELTADRLGADYERYYDKLSDRERDAISVVRNALFEIAEGKR